MQTTSTKLATARQNLQNAAEHHRNLYASGKALEAHVSKLENLAVIRFQICQPTDPLNVSNSTGPVLAELHGSAMADLGAAAAAMAALHKSSDYKTACDLIGPLVAAVRELEAQLAEETTKAQQADIARREAIEAAKAKALAKIERDFPEPAIA